MKRIDTQTKATDKFGVGRHGFTNGNPSISIPATEMDASWFDHVQEEISNVVEGAGLTLDGAIYNQLAQAIQAMISGAIGALPDPFSLPVGSILPCPSTTPWDGFYLADGSLLTRADDPDLWAYADGSGNIVDEVDWSLETSGSFSNGDGATTFRLPDFRGIALRGLDAGRGLDPERTLGTYQAAHAGSFTFQVQTYGVATGAAALPDIILINGTVFGDDQLQRTIAVTPGDTRMKNAAVNFCIKY